MKLSKEEKELLDSVERGEWKTIPNFKQEAKRVQEYAEPTYRKDKRVNIRISEKDLPSGFTRDALRDAINRFDGSRLEQEHRRGYELHPVNKTEFSVWKEEQDWGDE